MLNRLFHSTVALIALVIAYQVYVLTVAPIVEPPAVVKAGKQIDQSTRKDSYDAFSRYRNLLASYFPAGHWALEKPSPKVLRFDSIMLVVKDYRRHDDGSVDLDECAVLVMPGDWEFGEPAPREAVVVEAPGGAHLQFDDDFQPTRGKAGRIVDGRFPGEITIRSDMKLPGPDDDLLIVTSNLEINNTRIHTDEAVTARWGPNHGSGRKMVIRLSRDEHIKRGPSINGVNSLEVLEEVVLHLDPGDVDLLSEEEASSDKVANRSQLSRQRSGAIQLTAAHEPNSEFRPMVEVKCAGRFHFDLLNYIASFNRQVRVRRERLNNSFDQVDCDELAVEFSPVDEEGVPIDSDDPDITRRQRKAAGRFEPVQVTATGHPVRAESPEANASARANRVRINLYARRITLDEGREVMLAYKGDEIHAPLIEYQMANEESPSAVGELAVAGPGWLRAVPDVDRPDRVVDIAWKSTPETRYPLQLTRRNGQPVLLMAGHPVIDAHRLGKISAQRMELQLREVPADGEAGPALELTKSAAKLAIIPERLLASGDVVFASRKLTGRTHQLQGDFEPWKPQNGPPMHRAGNSLDDSLGRDEDPNRPTAQYDLSANQIQLDLMLSGKKAEPSAVACDGAVVLRETRTAKPGEQPLEVRGTRLTVDQLNTDAKIIVFGRPDPQLGGPGTATVSARGLTMAAERIQADQASGRLWVNGPGMASMNMDGEVFGQPAGTSTPVSLSWQTGLDAAGKRIVASGRILAESQYGWVQADRAVALLTRPVQVERGSGQGKIEVAQIALEGHVAGDHRGVDESGQTSHESFQLKTLSYDRLTGNVQGTGPGVLRSVRLSDGSMSFADLASATTPGSSQITQPAASPKPKSEELRFLRVDFADGLSGNVDKRVVRFHGRVRSVYGPVSTWQDELPLHAPDRLPYDTVTLGCETLEVNEDPVARTLTPTDSQLGPLEIRAIDNVEIEGRSEKNGLFQAQASTASYSQQKDLFVLKGDGQQDAVIRHRDVATGRYVTTPAGTILYYRAEPRVELKDVHRPIDFQQTRPQAAAPRSRPIIGPIR